MMAAHDLFVADSRGVLDLLAAIRSRSAAASYPYSCAPD